MANNVTNPNVLQAPPVSQIDTQSIVGLPPVQSPPVQSGVKPGSGTVGGGSSPYTYNEKKTKGNNPER